MKLTLGTLMTPRVHRRSGKHASAKRPLTNQSRMSSGSRESVEACDNSNDSGLGFDHHLDYPIAHKNNVAFTDDEKTWGQSDVKRKKLDYRLESDNAHDDFTFPETMSCRGKREVPDRGHILRSGSSSVSFTDPSQREHGSMSRNDERYHTRPVAVASRKTGLPVTLNSHLLSSSRNNKTHLQILCQPEQQHRARYQTEGSRGAVKDRSGNGFPIVKLVGYDKPAVLQVFIGTDVGRVAPHMFYQACRVSGKNSTPCVEKKIEGTIVIEVNFDPAKDMVVTCDCVGILKERNVDVEHRFPDQPASRNKKKSTRCRMIFRTTITHPDGSSEVLQVASQSILCTQPPGVPEICKKSLTTCPCTGGAELFILGKNFLKDTKVIFQQSEMDTTWEEIVQPDKEFLQQTHLVCVVPAYRSCEIREPVNVRLMVISSGKTSEPHNFSYTPVNHPVVAPELMQPCVSVAQPRMIQGMELGRGGYPKSPIPMSGSGHLNSDLRLRSRSAAMPVHFLSHESLQNERKDDQLMWSSQNLVPDIPKNEGKKRKEKESDKNHGLKVLAPPALLPLPARRLQSSSSVTPLQLISSPDSIVSVQPKPEVTHLSPEDVKGIDLRVKPITTLLPLTSVDQTPSMATLQQLVSNDTTQSLPTQTADSVEKYLSRLENKIISSQQMISPVKKEELDYVPRDLVPLFAQHANADLRTTMPSVSKEFIDVSSLQLMSSEPCIPQQQTSMVHNSMSASSVLGFNMGSPPAGTLVKTLLQNESKSVKIEHNNGSNMLTVSDKCTVQGSVVSEEIIRSSIVSQTQNSGLEVLVSSTVNHHAVPSSNQPETSVSEKLNKLDALVNSAADSHLSSGTDFQASSSEKLIMVPNSSPTVSSSSFQLTPSEQSVQIINENAVLNKVVADALNEHLLGSSVTESKSIGNNINVAKSPDVHSPISTVCQQQMETHIVLRQSPEIDKQMLISHSSGLSPIAVKNILMSSVTEADSGTVQTAPIAMKRILMDEPDISTVSEQMMSVSPVSANSGSVRTSPIALKTMILSSESPNANTGNILSVSPMPEETRLNNSPPASCSPSIAVKTMIVNPEVSTTIANKIISACSDSNDVNNICQPSTSTNIFSSSSVSGTVVTDGSVFIPPMIGSEGIASLLPVSQDQQQNSLSMSQTSSVPSSVHPSQPCLTTSNTSAQTLLQQQLENMFAPSSSSPSHSTGFLNISQVQNTNIQDILSSTVKVDENTSSQVERANAKFLTDSLITMVKDELKENSGTLVDALRKSENGENLISAIERQEQSPTISTLPVPVVDLSSKTLPVMGPIQKKSEEGMVPQELAQMSDHDLLRYINPSCFDQV